MMVILSLSSPVTLNVYECVKVISSCYCSHSAAMCPPPVAAVKDTVGRWWRLAIDADDDGEAEVGRFIFAFLICIKALGIPQSGNCKSDFFLFCCLIQVSNSTAWFILDSFVVVVIVLI